MVVTCLHRHFLAVKPIPTSLFFLILVCHPSGTTGTIKDHTGNLGVPTGAVPQDQQQGYADVGAPGWPVPMAVATIPLCALQHLSVQGWTPMGVCVQL